MTLRRPSAWPPASWSAPWPSPLRPAPPGGATASGTNDNRWNNNYNDRYYGYYYREPPVVYATPYNYGYVPPPVIYDNCGAGLLASPSGRKADRRRTAGSNARRFRLRSPPTRPIVAAGRLR